MGEQSGDPGEIPEVDLGQRGQRAWTALLADLGDADRELLWAVGVALLHRMRHDRLAEPS